MTQVDIFNKYYGKARNYPKVWIILGIIFVLLLLFWFPQWEVAKYGITTPKDLSDAENSHRATLAQILGGVAVAGSLYYTWRRVTIAEKELKVSQEGQITERFTRAVDQLGATDQLGKPAMEIRLGGIYALERISNESEKDYWPIMEILTAYIRKNSPEEVIVRKKVTPISMDIQANETSTIKVQKEREMTLDIQAIIIIIRRREYYLKEQLKYLNLQKTYLRSAQLNDTYLENADFTGCYLRNVNFMRTHLKGALFAGADLYLAIFEEAQLEGANFLLAKLIDAYFTEAQLEGAFFSLTQLEGANFHGANLEGANFQYADLRGAYGLSVDQLSKVKTLYEAQLDKELEKPLKEKYPALFEDPYN